VGVCQCEEPDCEDLLLQAEDVKVWELEPGKLGRAVARALGCEVKCVDLRLRRTMQIGALGDGPLPIVMTLQPDEESFRAVAGELVARLPKGFVLLAPTSRFCTAPATEMLARVNAGFFSLERLVTLLANGRLHAEKNGGELFAVYLTDGRGGVDAVAMPATGEGSGGAAPEFLIMQEGTRRRAGKHDRTMISTWRIRFRGHEVLMPEKVGTELLVHMIRNQGKESNASALTEAVRKSGPAGGNKKGEVAREILRGQEGDGDESDELRGRVGDAEQRDVIWDDREIAVCLRKINGLATEVKEHEEAGDDSSQNYLALKEELEEQQDLLRANAKQVKGKWIPKEYRKGTFAQKADLIRKHVSGVLNGYLRENCRPLFDHLNDRNTLVYGVKNRYQPKPRVAWEVQLKGDKTGM